MAGVTRRRARSPEDKAARRQSVLDEAWRLFQGTPWSELTLAQVAEGVGLSKAALYRYFLPALRQAVTALLHGLASGPAPAHAVAR